MSIRWPSWALATSTTMPHAVSAATGAAAASMCERVEGLLRFVSRDPDEIVCRLAPRNGEATVRRIAANAVMAGCRPEHLPVVITAVEAAADPALNLNGMQSTTHPTQHWDSAAA